MPNEIAIDLNNTGKSLFPRGKRATGPIDYCVARELTALDITERMVVSVDSQPAPLQRLRDSHHHVARLLSDGQSAVYISAITGYAPNTIAQLKRDPAFQELMEHYKNEVAEIFIDVTKRLRDVSLDAVTTISDRLAENPDAIATKDLISVAQMGADRSGNGPTSTQLSVNANITPEKMAAMQEAARQGNTGVKVLDAKQEPTKTPTLDQRPQDNPVPDES